jgi:hypothetical protein
MYDRFEAGRLVDLDPFLFNSNRFEVWNSGRMVKSGSVSHGINVSTSRSGNGLSTMHVNFQTENSLISLIKNELNFDTCFFGTDRIIGATIALKSNIEDNDSFNMFRSSAIAQGQFVRKEKIFEKNEPYASCLFVVKGLPSKLTFTNAIYHTLIEFYWD